MKRTIEVVVDTRDDRTEANQRASELARAHPDRRYGVIETDFVQPPPRTADRFCVMERRAVLA